MRDYKKAAATLKGVAEHISGPLKGEVTQRLALLLEQAGDFKEAAVYWQKLVNEGANPVRAPLPEGKAGRGRSQGEEIGVQFRNSIRAGRASPFCGGHRPPYGCQGIAALPTSGK